MAGQEMVAEEVLTALLVWFHTVSGRTPGPWCMPFWQRLGACAYVAIVKPATTSAGRSQGPQRSSECPLARTPCRRQYERDASLVPPTVVHGLEIQTVSPQRTVPPVRQARGPPRQYAYRHLDGADDGSGDKAGTDRGMFGAWSPAVQRPLHEGVEREVPADTVAGQRRLPLARGRSPGQVREELRRFTFNPAALATDPRFRSAPGPLIAARHSEAALRFFMASLPALP